MRRREGAAGSLGNLLYRIEIHTSGCALTASPEQSAGNVAAATALAAADQRQLRVEDRATIADWRAGDSIALQPPAANDPAGQPPQNPVLVRLLVVDTASGTLTFDGPLQDFAADSEIILRRVATFKWSRDNASQAWATQAVESGSKVIQLQNSGRDDLELVACDWVELVDDRCALDGTPGFLAQVETVDPEHLEITLDSTPPAGLGDDIALHPILRRWDQSGPSSRWVDGALAVETNTWLALENEIEVQFGTGSFRAG